MKLLSIDIESTGLSQNDLIIEFAMIPFDTDKRQIESSLQQHFLIQCPSFDKLKSNLDPWVIEHNEKLIKKAHEEGIPLGEFKKRLEDCLNDKKLRDYFSLKKNEGMIIFGKSLNAIDLPFLIRDLGWNFMRKYFHYHVVDLTSVVYSLVDLRCLPVEVLSGSALAKHYGIGEVAHTALEDAYNMALIYTKILKQFRK
ncbi:MAG: exonuclease domain-containing protein [Halobacteriovoraceae bacterium]|nr:exonuclease domain-containing protein [Halobacteriovoraceae bacterium]